MKGYYLMSDGTKNTKIEIGKTSVYYGITAAMIISYSLNKSVLWMLIHGFFSWFYVFYFLLFLQ